MSWQFAVRTLEVLIYICDIILFIFLNQASILVFISWAGQFILDTSLLKPTIINAFLCATYIVGKGRFCILYSTHMRVRGTHIPDYIGLRYCCGDFSDSLWLYLVRVPWKFSIRVFVFSCKREGYKIVDYPFCVFYLEAYAILWQLMVLKCCNYKFQLYFYCTYNLIRCVI